MKFSLESISQCFHRIDSIDDRTNQTAICRPAADGDGGMAGEQCPCANSGGDIFRNLPQILNGAIPIEIAVYDPAAVDLPED